MVSLGLEVRQVNRTGREDKGAEEGDVERKEREAGGRRRSEEDPDEGPGVGGRGSGGGSKRGPTGVRGPSLGA